MVKYESPTQLSIEEFKTPFQSTLLPDNKWVKLSAIVPWDKFASAYIAMMNTGFGRPGISPRVVLGSLIIKHIEKLDDRGVIAAIQENIYMQYFIGLKAFDPHPVFDPSLFVELRKRVGSDIFDALNVDLIKSFSEK
ncbi:MAG: IS5 family transposase [Bacteroidia bacterium]|jgi:IS5 family transposase